MSIFTQNSGDFGNISIRSNWHSKAFHVEPKTIPQEHLESLQPDNIGRHKDSVKHKMTGSTTDNHEVSKLHLQYSGAQFESSPCICNLVRGDSGLEGHAKHFPSCPFANSARANLMQPEANISYAKPSSEQGGGWRTLSCVIAVAKLGFSMSDIQHAVTNVKTTGVSIGELNTDAILDELFSAGSRITDEPTDSDTESLALIEDTDPSIYRECNDTEEDAIQPTCTSPDTQENDSKCNDHQNDPPQNVPRCTSNDAIQEDKSVKQPSNRSQSKHCEAKPELEETIANEIQSLRKQNEDFKSTLTCKVCLDERVGELFLPCRHLVCCVNCASSVHTCPVCREQIVGTIKTFVTN